MSDKEILREDVRELIDRAGDKALRMVKAILEIEVQEDIEEVNTDDEEWEYIYQTGPLLWQLRP